MHYTEIIKRKLQERIRSNPRYSLRALARDSKIDPGFLSHLLNGTKKLSVARGSELARGLKLSPTEQDLFLKLIQLEEARSEESRQEILRSIHALHSMDTIQEIEMETFTAVSDWYHNAILEMTADPAAMTPKSISRRLGLTEMEAKLALDRLLSVGLLKRKAGRTFKSIARATTKPDVLSAAVQNRHKQILQKASEALESQALDEREFHSITAYIDPKRIPEAKQRIKKFMWELCESLESGERKEAYEMAFQLFSLEKKRRKEDRS